MDTMGLTEKEHANQPDWHKLVPDYAGTLHEEIDNLRWNIRLLGAPMVFERVEVSYASLLVAISAAEWPQRHTIERRHELADNALRAWQDLSDAMRADLRGDEEALRQLATRFYGDEDKSMLPNTSTPPQRKKRHPNWRKRFRRG